MRREGPIAVIPARNEAPAVGRVVRSLLNRGWHVVVVDDGSIDSTVYKSKCAGATVVPSKGRGYSAAVRTGLATSAALKARCVALLDADGQHAAEDVNRLWQFHIRECADLTIGDRFSKPSGLYPLKEAANSFAASLVYRTVGLRLNDVSCGLRLLSTRALRATGHVEASGFELPYAQVCSAAREGLVVKAHPIQMLYPRGDCPTREVELLALLAVARRCAGPRERDCIETVVAGVRKRKLTGVDLNSEGRFELTPDNRDLWRIRQKPSEEIP